MRTNKKNLHQQRRILEKRVKNLLALRSLGRPPGGQINFVRGALGLTARQLGSLMGVNHSAVIALEHRESKGAATVESLEKAARAMKCKLVYAVVPEDRYSSFEEILDERAMSLARKIADPVLHTMKLESQGVNEDDGLEDLKILAQSVKEKLDSRLWEMGANGHDKVPSRKKTKGKNK
ncbi:MAG: transcriptional regulator [Oligoflexia bacterium]|nr:transcriptional regulator [Oligoflexia bacterium]